MTRGARRRQRDPPASADHRDLVASVKFTKRAGGIRVIARRRRRSVVFNSPSAHRQRHPRPSRRRASRPHPGRSSPTRRSRHRPRMAITTHSCPHGRPDLVGASRPGEPVHFTSLAGPAALPARRRRDRCPTRGMPVLVIDDNRRPPHLGELPPPGHGPPGRRGGQGSSNGAAYNREAVPRVLLDSRCRMGFGVREDRAASAPRRARSWALLRRAAGRRHRCRTRVAPTQQAIRQSGLLEATSPPCLNPPRLGEAPAGNRILCASRRGAAA